jgi:crossover junction endodeoxyribonuclease RuvC
VLEAGVIRGGRAERPLEIRLARLHAGLVELLETFRPTTIAVEQVHSQMRRPLAAVQLAHARGVLVLAAGQRGISVVGYSATGVKRTLTGNGRASKDQVQNAIRIELGLDSFPQPSDVADACALALCHLAQEAGRQRLAEIG